MNTIQITTPRLHLEPLGMKFLDSTHIYASDYENMKYMIHLPNNNLQETISFLKGVDEAWNEKEQSSFEFAILLDNVHIGAVSLYIDDQNIGELGWIIAKQYWKQGYATEAAKAVMEYANTKWNVKRFIAHCDSENMGSYKVMERLGMTLKEKTSGRKNRASDESREEFMYECIL